MVEFGIFAFVTSITPGPNNSMLMASGIRFGRKKSLPHFFGIWLGFNFLFFLGGNLLSYVPETSAFGPILESLPIINPPVSGAIFIFKWYLFKNDIFFLMYYYVCFDYFIRQNSKIIK